MYDAQHDKTLRLESQLRGPEGQGPADLHVHALSSRKRGHIGTGRKHWDQPVGPGRAGSLGAEKEKKEHLALARGIYRGYVLGMNNAQIAAIRDLASKAFSAPRRFRVITWTERDGVNGVTDDMSEASAKELASLLRETNPAWLHVDVEGVAS